MKKILSMLIAALLCLALISGCGATPAEAQPTSSDPTASTASEPNTTTTEPNTITSKPTTTTAARTKTSAPDPVILTPEQSIYPVGTKEITVTWFNGSEEDLIFGYPFILQAGRSSGWVDAEPVEQLMFLLPGFLLKPGESKDNTYDISHYYGPLEAGRYRIAASYFYDKDRPINKNTPQHEVYAEFEIT